MFYKQSCDSYVFSNIQHNKTDQREALCILSECRHENQIITSIILLEEQQCNIEEHEQQFFSLNHNTT